VRGVRIAERDDDRVRIDVETVLPTEPSPSRCLLSFTVCGDASVEVEMVLEPGDGLPEIPVVGMLATVPARFARLSWYGRGPQENYADRRAGAHVGVYEATVREMFHPFIRPQVTGNVTDVRWATLHDGAGYGVTVHGHPVLEVTALHHTPWDLEGPRHPHELAHRDEVYWQLNHGQLGLGGIDSWGARTRPAYTLYADRPYSYRYRLVPASPAGAPVGPDGSGPAADGRDDPAQTDRSV